MKTLPVILKTQRLSALSFAFGGILFSLGRQFVLIPAISRDSPELLPDFLFFLFLSDVIVNAVGASLADAFFKDSQESSRSTSRYIALIVLLHIPVGIILITIDRVVGISVVLLSLIYSLNQIVLKWYQRDREYAGYLRYNAARFSGYCILATVATEESVPVLIFLLAAIEFLAAAPLWMRRSIFTKPAPNEGALKLPALSLFMCAYALSALTIRCDVLLGTQILDESERIRFSQLLMLTSLMAFPLSLFTGGYFFNRLCEQRPKIRSIRLLVTYPCLISLIIGSSTWILSPLISKHLLSIDLYGTDKVIVSICASVAALLPYFRSIQLALQTSVVVMASNAVSLAAVAGVLFVTAHDAAAAIFATAFARALALYITLYLSSWRAERISNELIG